MPTPYPFLPPTVDQFKAQFFRDFNYAVPSFGATVTPTIVAGVVTALAILTGGQYYKTPPAVQITPAPLACGEPGPGSGATANCTVANGAVTGITDLVGGTGYTNGIVVTFVGGSGDSTQKLQVQDQDILNAINVANANINPGMFGQTVNGQNQFIVAYNYLAAHYLVGNMRAATQGLDSDYNWWNTSKSAGDFSEGFDLPQFIKDNPTLAFLGKTAYGATYLSLVVPLMPGNIRILPKYPWNSGCQ